MSGGALRVLYCRGYFFDISISYDFDSVIDE